MNGPTNMAILKGNIILPIATTLSGPVVRSVTIIWAPVQLENLKSQTSLKWLLVPNIYHFLIGLYVLYLSQHPEPHI